jgi:plastocyanin
MIFHHFFSPEGTLENAFMVFEPSANDTVLYYYCLFHNGMANDAKIIIDNYVEASQEVIPTTISVQNSGSSNYTITSQSLSDSDPILTLERGKTYEFDVNSPGHPFWIKTEQVNGTSNSYLEGITNNGTSNGKLTFTVSSDAPAKLYYICQIHSSMTGVINIVDSNMSGTIISSSSSGTNGTNGTNDTEGSSTPSYGYSADLDVFNQYDQGIIFTPSYDM